jgi:hypothetical protein
MNYITIADLKKQAKKERKNNNSIKNHADSLNLVAKKNNFDSWSDLLDNSVIIKKNELANEDQINLLKEFINDSLTLINEFNLIFKTNNHEMLAIFINKHFLYQSINKVGDEYFWRNRAKKWMEQVCFIFVYSDLPRNIKGLRHCFLLENMLEIIEDKQLHQHENVKCLFEQVLYEPQNNQLIEPSYEVLNQNGYCSMQYTAHIGFVADSLSKILNNEFSINKNKIKELILNQPSLFTYDSFGTTLPILDQKKLFTRYRNSFKTEDSFKTTLKKHLESI